MMKTVLRSCFGVAALAAGSWLAGGGDARAQPGFGGLRVEIAPIARARGVTDATLESAFAGLVPDPEIAMLIRGQPEFGKPVGRYLADAVTRSRIDRGRAQQAAFGDALRRIEDAFGVPGPIVVAIWGLETGYGAATGSKDVVRSLATLAALRHRGDFYRDELVEALVILQSGIVPRPRFRGSWAGAMGQTQFMPSSYARHAVDGDGDGRRDVWSSVPDALASAANYLARHGWVPGLPAAVEIELPAGYDLRLSRDSFPEWRRRGVSRADGRALPDSGEGILFHPSGHAGPAFLATANFMALKSYNFSDAYALAVLHLAARIEGGEPIRGAWPDILALPRAERIAMQVRLRALGHPVPDGQGRIDLDLRDVIRKVQAERGLVPDGQANAAFLKAIGVAAPAR